MALIDQGSLFATQLKKVLDPLGLTIRKYPRELRWVVRSSETGVSYGAIAWNDQWIVQPSDSAEPLETRQVVDAALEAVLSSWNENHG